jgi:DNA mismatch repair protein MutH
VAEHKVLLTITKTFEIGSKDIVFEIKSKGAKLGKLLISQGNIEWQPTKAQVNKRRLSWEKFADMMAEGKKTRIKPKTTK